jgi:hypothetical protein
LYVSIFSSSRPEENRQRGGKKDGFGHRIERTVQSFSRYGVLILLLAFADIVNLSVARLRLALYLNARFIESGRKERVFHMGLEKMRVAVDTVLHRGIS